VPGAGVRDAPTRLPLHLATPPADQAPLVLCPGDPARARAAAEELLTGAALVTDRRGLLGYTGRFGGVPVTVQTTGMGGGSTGIVVAELIELGARVLVRAGSAGGIAPSLARGSLVVADAAVADDGAALALAGPRAPAPDGPLAGALEAAARAVCGEGRAVARGPVVSTDLFYDPGPPRHPGWAARGLLAVEMEAATLFALAARAGVRAGCVLGVSNRLGDDAEGWVDPRAYRELGLLVAEVGLRALVAEG
jgi:purine-nucleoside phosphorylase